MKKKTIITIGGIVAVVVFLVLAAITTDIHQYGEGKITLGQVLDVNLFHDTTRIETRKNSTLFLTNHNWTGDDLKKLGCKETSRMGAEGFYTTKDGKHFSVTDLDKWCLFFRFHSLRGITMEELGLHT